MLFRSDPERWSTALGAACLWGLAEVLLARGPLFWIGLGSSALPGDPALAGLASIGGAGLVAAVQVLLGWCLWRLTRASGRRLGWLLLMIALVLTSHLLGLAALAPVKAETGANALAAADQSGTRLVAAHRLAEERVLVLQPAIPTRRKFEPDQQRELLRQLAKIGRAHV